jgi:hypothetical protein
MKESVDTVKEGKVINAPYGFPSNLKEWADDLIGCPSQCYYRFKYRGNNWVIYLRWRHQDPWTAILIECPENWNIHDTGTEWLNIPVDFYKENELDALKTEVIAEAYQMIKSL